MPTAHPRRSRRRTAEVRPGRSIVEGTCSKFPTAFYVATYEHDVPCANYVDSNFDVADAADACQYVIGKGVFADLERPITAACLVDTGTSWDISVADVPQAE